MQKFTRLQVSLFYLFLIALLGYVGFVYGSRMGSKVGVTIGDSLGSAIGAVGGVVISYQLFEYVRRNNMLA